MASMWDALVGVARAIEAMQEDIAEGGSVITVVDSKLGTKGLPAGAFVGGTVFIDTAVGIVPVHNSRYVSGYTSAGTITAYSNFDLGACGSAGDWYGVTGNFYPRSIMAGKINEALGEMGDVPAEDISLTSTGLTDYTLPAAARRDLRQVWTGTPPDYELNTRWQTAKGDTLRFLDEPGAGDTIKLIYMAKHPRVWADADTVQADIDYLAVAAGVKLVRWRLEQPGSDKDRLTQLLNDLMTRQVERKRARPSDTPKRTPIFPSR